MARRISVVPEAGQLCAAPLRDGSVGLVQVASVVEPEPRPEGSRRQRTFFTTLAFFPVRADDAAQLTARADGVPLDRPLVVLSPSSTPVEDGELPVIGSREVAYVDVDVAARLNGWGWFDGRQAPWSVVLDMYFGLFPWDGFHDPRWLDKLLLPGVERPTTARLRADFDTDELARLGLQP